MPHAKYDLTDIFANAGNAIGKIEKFELDSP